MGQSIALFEHLEARQLLTAGPSASFLQYVKGTGSSRVIGVLYQGPAPIGRASLDDGDIFVSSNRDVSVDVTFMGAVKHQPGNGYIAQYRLDDISPGKFRIQMESAQVSDTDGGQVPGGDIGWFDVATSGQATVVKPLPPMVQVIGTTFGSSEFPPEIDTSYGPVVRALNFGGDALTVEGSTGVDVAFLSQLGPGSRKQRLRLASSPIQISFNGGFGSVFNRITGDNPLFETEIYGGSPGMMSMTISGLDPNRRYRIQYLHGDNRLGSFPYPTTTQTFALGVNALFATTPLSFNTAESNEDSNTAIIVAGTDSVTYNMPGTASRPPGFSGVVISLADTIVPAAPAPVFVRNSIRLVETGQLFDMIFSPAADVATSLLAPLALQVTGPRGYAASAKLVNTTTNSNGKVIATYLLDGIDLTGSYTISLGGAKLATSTLFHLKPIIWS